MPSFSDMQKSTCIMTKSIKRRWEKKRILILHSWTWRWYKGLCRVKNERGITKPEKTWPAEAFNYVMHSSVAMKTLLKEKDTSKHLNLSSKNKFPQHWLAGGRKLLVYGKTLMWINESMTDFIRILQLAFENLIFLKRRFWWFWLLSPSVVSLDTDSDVYWRPLLRSWIILNPAKIY